jgi:hypothetical protein
MKGVILSLLLLLSLPAQASLCAKYTGNLLQNLSYECRSVELPNYILCMGQEGSFPAFRAGYMPVDENQDSLEGIIGTVFYKKTRPSPLSPVKHYYARDKGRVISYVYDTVHSIKLDPVTGVLRFYYRNYMKFDHIRGPSRNINFSLGMNCNKL